MPPPLLQKASPPPPPPPPPPPASPARDATNGHSATVGGATSALFAEICTGGDNITAQLRHVEDHEKAYKQNVQHGAVDFSGLEKKKAEADARRQQQGRTAAAVAAEEPVLHLEGDKRWVVKYHRGTPTVQKKVTLDKVSMRQAVQIFNSEYLMVEIKGKVNSVSVVSCNKVQVVMDSVVSSLEVLKSGDIDVKVHRAVPTASVEKSTSVNLYLMDKDEALNTDIFTACSSAVNLNFPSEEDATDIIERPLPEQFVSKIVRDKRGGFKIETKPSEIT
ncbi:G-actin binding protein [Trypanosoma rangeli]|uniref:G-actin binding protein n=1 Tax=Trypanosoma rangeli TaxID=5698 RepID=A0A3R7NFV7_TRYRA|nr:G-actin binding protein [Trypanosoma rangeli]RNF05943.1 G-actin binding protein [Trypanosoma rangeli]|eukprot:RNF05943.1 G-actin binding protein [Trypanosoma rangeli]